MGVQEVIVRIARLRRVMVFAVVLICAFGLPATAETVGLIAEVSGSASLRSSGVVRPARVGAGVESGDQITVASGRVVIDIPSGSLLIRPGNSPFTLAGDARTSSGLSRFLTRVSNLLRADAAPGPANATSRGPIDPPSLALLAKSGSGQTQRIVGGKRALFLEWTATNKPYKISLLQDAKTLAELASDDTRIVMPLLDLKPSAKPIKITVVDARGLRVEGTVEVAAAAPTLPGVGRAELNTPVARMLAISWLGGQDKGAWTFEAYQQLQALRPSYPLAGELASKLAAGGKLY